MVFFVGHLNNLQMSRHMNKSNLLKVLSLMCILQVGEGGTIGYMCTFFFSVRSSKMGASFNDSMLAKLCRLYGLIFQHDILLQQEHEAPPHSSVVQVHLDCKILYVLLDDIKYVCYVSVV